MVSEIRRNVDFFANVVFIVKLDSISQNLKCVTVVFSAVEVYFTKYELSLRKLFELQKSSLEQQAVFCSDLVIHVYITDLPEEFCICIRIVCIGIICIRIVCI